MASHALNPNAAEAHFPFKVAPGATSLDTTVSSAGAVPSVAPSGGEKEAAPVGIHKAALDNLAAVYHTFASLGGVVTLLACLFDIAAKENAAGPALSGLASNNVSPPVELGLSRICPKCRYWFWPSENARKHAQACSNLVLICNECNLQRRSGAHNRGAHQTTLYPAHWAEGG